MSTTVDAVSRRLDLATGIDAHVLTWDGGGDHTVVLVHGFLDFAYGWAPAVRAGLADGLHVVAPDMRGHGDSAWIGAGGYYHFFDYVADLASLVEQLGRERVSLVGHSMGGTITSYFAGTFPERVHRLVLMEGLGPPEEPRAAPERVERWIASWEHLQPRARKAYPTTADAAQRLQSYDPMLSDELAAELAEHGTEPVDGGVAFKHDPLHLSRGPYPFRVEVAEELWRGVTAPTLLVDGSESRYRLEDDDLARRMAALPVAGRHTLDGAGHMMQRHRPNELAAIVREFLLT